MGAAFTNLFGRDFIVAHCLPSAVFLIIFTLIFAAVGAQALWAQPYIEYLAHLQRVEIKAALTDSSFAWALAAFLATTWLLGLVLYSVNTQIVRFFEGYGGLANPLYCFKVLQRRRLRKVEAFVREFKVKALAARAAGQDPPHDPAYQRAREELANRFPKEVNLMPTRFGNTVRAFEVYPREMYGLEGVTGWFRLVSVIPKDYFAFIGSSRAQVDLCLNLTLVLWLCILEYLIMCAATFGNDVHLYPWPWLAFGLVAWAWVAMRSASSAAVIWGGWVKAAFDVYLNDLRTKLSFDAFESMESERHRWEGISQAIGYHSPGQLRHRKPISSAKDADVARKPGFVALICKALSAIRR